ncbi:MAG: hypothetical protein QOI31_516 [Solirubrobacterales bacterium]|nr:hypothetical protein [Solirubrobacterales bacterium]
MSDVDASTVPIFGARKRAKELAEEVASLREELDRLGALSLIELERRRASLAEEIEGETARLEAEQREAAAALERDRTAAEAEARRDIEVRDATKRQLEARVRELRTEIVETEELALLQEAGVYEYEHPLSDSVEYEGELKNLRSRIKEMVRADGGAVQATTGWTVNNSAAAGRKMVRDFSKLMLRAYNAEADNLVRGLKPYKLASAIERLSKVAGTIEKLGKTMDIRISGDYHGLRIYELELTADYRQKLAEEKEREREERERLREERKAQQEIERERARLAKEQQQYANALAVLEEKGDLDGAARMRGELEEITRAIEDVDYRAANIRAGFVYVISNVGSFGDQVVKIGMTRRLEPAERVRELGDASVPFRYDTHALFFSNDAVEIEAKLHKRLAARRVNRVNNRREFFYATPNEVKALLLELTGELLQYEELPEALEFRQSQTLAASGAATTIS